jgi:hypothetical protein
MTEPVERQLRDIFAEDADRAPQAGDPLAGVVMKRVRHRRLLLTVAAGVSAIAMVSIFAVTSGLLAGSAGPGVVESSCVKEYTLGEVVNRAFAFDGTVARIAPEHQDTARSGTVPVTFTVNEWFRGGSGSTVTVDVPRSVSPEESTDESVPKYDVGDRLLVSGEPRFGGAATDDAIAWGCGFTRPFEAHTAREWRQAFPSQ